MGQEYIKMIYASAFFEAQKGAWRTSAAWRWGERVNLRFFFNLARACSPAVAAAAAAARSDNLLCYDTPVLIWKNVRRAPTQSVHLSGDFTALAFSNGASRHPDQVFFISMKSHFTSILFLVLVLFFVSTNLRVTKHKAFKIKNKCMFMQQLKQNLTD